MKVSKTLDVGSIPTRPVFGEYDEKANISDCESDTCGFESHYSP